MKTVRLAVVALALATAAGATFAQDKRLSVSLFGLATKYSGTDEVGVIFGEVGYLFTERIEGGITFSKTLGAAESQGIGVNGKYYFGGVAQAKTWLPYAHARVQRTSGDFFDSTDLRAGVGVDIPVGQSASVVVELAYLRSDQSFAVGGNRDVNGTELLTGLRVRF
jgi:hypothetical protein